MRESRCHVSADMPVQAVPMPSQSRLQIVQVASDIWIDLLELHYKQYKPAIARPQAPCRRKG